MGQERLYAGYYSLWRECALHPFRGLCPREYERLHGMIAFPCGADAHYTLSEGVAQWGKSDCTQVTIPCGANAHYTLSEGVARGRKGGLIFAIAERCKNGGFSAE